ncbi:alpha/beta fold hydrolase [Streptomyces asoensis]|uniref:alpha/beta fold hydrolase n=1 Tax=Streptomyces asoensis TaxID=249586 RepID=UPI0037213FF3
MVLLHGFPYDAHSYDAVTALLLPRGARVVTPYLRGFGPTGFRDPRAVRSGQQAAIGTDVAELIRESGLDAPVLAGFDWGGRAACVAAALWPELVGGLVAIGGNEIQDIAGSAPHGRGLRQPRFRRCRRPLLPPPVRAGAGRRTVRRGRAAPRGQAGDRCPDDRAGSDRGPRDRAARHGRTPDVLQRPGRPHPCVRRARHPS